MDRGKHGRDTGSTRGHSLDEEGLRDGGRVGHAGGLDNDAVKLQLAGAALNMSSIHGLGSVWGRFEIDFGSI